MHRKKNNFMAKTHAFRMTLRNGNAPRFTQVLVIQSTSPIKG